MHDLEAHHTLLAMHAIPLGSLSTATQLRPNDLFDDHHYSNLQQTSAHNVTNWAHSLFRLHCLMRLASLHWLNSTCVRRTQHEQHSFVSGIGVDLAHSTQMVVIWPVCGLASHTLSIPTHHNYVNYQSNWAGVVCSTGWYHSPTQITM